MKVQKNGSPYLQVKYLLNHQGLADNRILLDHQSPYFYLKLIKVFDDFNDLARFSDPLAFGSGLGNLAINDLASF